MKTKAIGGFAIIRYSKNINNPSQSLLAIKGITDIKKMKDSILTEFKLDLEYDIISKNDLVATVRLKDNNEIHGLINNIQATGMTILHLHIAEVPYNLR